MSDDIAIMLGACAIDAAGIGSGHTVTMLEATRLAALALGRARSPEMVGLVGAASAYPERTSLVETGIAGVVSAAHREKQEEWLDGLAVVWKKLLDQYRGPTAGL